MKHLPAGQEPTKKNWAWPVSWDRALHKKKGPLAMALGVPHAPKVPKWMTGFLEDPSMDSLHCPGPKIPKWGWIKHPQLTMSSGLSDPHLALDGPHRPGKTLHQQGGAQLYSPLTPCNKTNNNLFQYTWSARPEDPSINIKFSDVLLLEKGKHQNIQAKI